MHRLGVITANDQARTAQALGADYVEPPIVGNLVTRDDHGRWRRVPGIEPPAPAPSFALLFPPDIPLADPSTSTDPVRDYLGVALDAAASVAEPGARIVFGSGTARTIPDGVDRAAAEARFVEVVVLARDLAAARGLTIMLEPLNRAETNLLHTIADCAAFLDAHGIEGVPVVADFFHLMVEGESLDVFDALGHRIGHVHVSDEDRRPPGTADWPLAEFLRAVRAGGYEGNVTIECRWSAFADELPDALAFVRSADVRE